jgi:hypothetical protein
MRCVHEMVNDLARLHIGYHKLTASGAVAKEKQLNTQGSSSARPTNDHARGELA